MTVINTDAPKTILTTLVIASALTTLSIIIASPNNVIAQAQDATNTTIDYDAIRANQTSEVKEKVEQAYLNNTCLSTIDWNRASLLAMKDNDVLTLLRELGDRCP